MTEVDELRAVGNEPPPCPHRIGPGGDQRSLELVEIDEGEVTILRRVDVGPEVDAFVGLSCEVQPPIALRHQGDRHERRVVLAVVVLDGLDEAEGGLAAVDDGDPPEVDGHAKPPRVGQPATSVQRTHPGGQPVRAVLWDGLNDVPSVCPNQGWTTRRAAAAPTRRFGGPPVSARPGHAARPHQSLYGVP